MSNAHIKSLNFAAIYSFTKIFDVSCKDTALGCMKTFDCREVSDVIVKRQLKYLHKDAQSDSIVCLARNEYLVGDLSLYGHVCGTSFSIYKLFSF